MVYPGWVRDIDFLVLRAREESSKEKRSYVNSSGTRDCLDRSYLKLRLESHSGGN